MLRNLPWVLVSATMMGCVTNGDESVAEPIEIGESALTPHACRAPWPSQSGTFNPDCVYLVGTLHEGLAGLDVIVHPSRPNHLVGGFGSGGPERATIRPDGRLVYQDFASIRVFGDDALGSASDVPLYPGGELYPANPRANDDLVDAPECASNTAHIEDPYLSTVFPDDGKVLYSCYDGAVFTEGSSSELMPQNRVVAGGPNRTTLIRSGWRKLALRTAAGVETELTGLPGHDFVLARFIDDHFIVALFDHTSNGASGQETTAERWHVALDGIATRVGSYQLDIGPTTSVTFFNHGKLDGTGAIHAITYSGFPSVDQVVRYTTNKPPVVVYEETNAKAKIHGAHLVTGG